MVTEPLLPPGRVPAPEPASSAELVSDLWALWKVLARRWKVVGATAGLAAAVTAVSVLAMRPVYEARAMILIEKVGSNALERDSVALDSVQDDYYQTQYQILQSRSLAERVTETLNLAAVPEFAAKDPVRALQGHVTIEPVRRTRLVNVRASSLDPKLAAAIANALAAAYEEQNLENSLFLSHDLLKALDGANATAAMESLPAVVNSTLIQQLKGELATLKGEAAEAAKRYTPEHPRMLELAAHIASLQSQIDREIRHIGESVKIQLSGEFKGNNVRVVDPAIVPDRPAWPRKTRSVLLALFLGLAAGFGIALAVDRWDLKIRGPEDAEALLRVPCLGTIQVFTGLRLGGRYEEVWTDPRSSGVEAFRNLRTAVSFRLAAVKGPTVLQVTSAVQEEGKSFLAANLARAYANLGERVLLVDGDLRRPSVHRIFGLTDEHGLSGFLANGAAHPDLKPSGVPNLWLLPSGPIPDNPPELLAERKLTGLLAWAASSFDRILVDCPPVFPVTDALLWAKHAHGALLVVGSGQARAVLVQRAVSRLKDAFATVLGAVVNKSAPDRLDAYHYYARYGYAYGPAPEPPGPAPAAPPPSTPSSKA